MKHSMSEFDEQSECSQSSLQLNVESDAQSGAWNMAVDEYLLEAALGENLKALRIYRWEEATVSLGYFQGADEYSQSLEFSGLPAVRRLSGGGAILHDQELTYSFVIPPDDPLSREPTSLYASIHSAIVTLLQRHGVPCSMRGEDSKLESEPFLCFVRGDRHDILCQGHKIVGSAQRRRRGAILQHGSVLLSASSAAPLIPGITELSGEFAAACRLPGFLSELAIELGNAIGATLGSSHPISDWPDKSKLRIAELQRDRYSSLDWGHRRTQ